jgi:hypothetical protein
LFESDEAAIAALLQISIANGSGIAMEAGISDHVWSLEEIAALADEDSK